MDQALGVTSLPDGVAKCLPARTDAVKWPLKHYVTVRMLSSQLNRSADEWRILRPITDVLL